MRLFIDSSGWNDNIEVRQLVLFVRTEVTMRSESLGLEIRRVGNDQSYRRLHVKLAVSYTTVSIKILIYHRPYDSIMFVFTY